jgi:acyl-CoA thioesterase I
MPVKPIKIACVGDSITFGFMVKQRSKHCYPQVLANLLGDDYQVVNFGVNGRTVALKHRDSYHKTKMYQYSLDYQPDIVLLMLGTNDTRIDCLKYFNDFKSDYLSLVNSYRQLASKPKVYVMTPYALFKVWQQPKVFYTMDEERLAQIILHITDLSVHEQLPLIDIHQCSLSHPEYCKLDGVHPNVDGAKLIAEYVAMIIKNSTAGV